MPRHDPYVAVVGTGEGSAEELQVAEEIGAGLAAPGAVVVTGGLGGVVEAASSGAESRRGRALGRPRGDGGAGAAVLVVVLGVRYMHHAAAGPSRAPAASAGPGGGSARGAPDGAAGGPGTVRVEAAAGGDALVHVAGAVRHPGVYRLGAGARV